MKLTFSTDLKSALLDLKNELILDRITFDATS